MSMYYVFSFISFVFIQPFYFISNLLSQTSLFKRISDFNW